MSTALQGIVVNPYGFIAVAGVTVQAYSTDGYTEGSTTTDSNGWFSLTGLSNKNWVARVASAPPNVSIILLLPNYVDHENLSTVTADQHHAGFVGLLDNAGEPIIVDSNDLIQITDDGVINADLSDVGILALSIDQSLIDHGTIDGLDDDDHTYYAHLGGRSGGQELFGGIDDDDNLTLVSNSAAVKGSVYLGDWTLFELAEATGQLILPTTGASAGILIGGDALWYRSAANVMRTPDALTVDGVFTASGGGAHSIIDNAVVTVDGGDNAPVDEDYAKWTADGLEGFSNSEVLADLSGDAGAAFDWGGQNIININSVYMVEQAAADDEIASSGQIWVKTGAPCTLWWTDDAGTDTQLGAAGAAHKDSHDPNDGADPLDTAAPINPIQPDDAAAEGTAHTFALSDHHHEITCDTPNAIVGVQAGAEGAGYYFARADHDHEIVASIDDNDLLLVDATAGAPADDEFARFTATGIEGRTTGEVVSDLSLDVPKRTIALRASGGLPSTTLPCAAAVQVEAGTNDVDDVYLDFDKDADEYAFWPSFDAPDNWDGGTFTARFKWTAAAGGAAETVRWAIQMAARDDGEDIDDAWGAAVLVDDTWIGNDKVHKSVESGAITPDTAGTRAGGDSIYVRVYRDVSGDDLSCDARLISIRLEYTTNAYSD